MMIDEQIDMYTGLYDTYMAAASEPNGSERLRLLRECATEGVRITSPFPYDVTGIEVVSDKLGSVAASMPDGRLLLRRTSEIDAHNGMFRAAFENCDSSGNRLSTGLHVVEVEDGRIARIMVFVPQDVPTSESSG